MEKEPHIVLLDTAANWLHYDQKKLIRGVEKSFCNEPALFDVDLHSDIMLQILSENLKNKVRISIARVVNSKGIGSPAAFSHGLIWAASLYPDVAVLPMGLMNPHSSVKASLEILANTGCKIFASVGDPGDDQNTSLYPAAYPECIAVGSARHQQDYCVWDHKPDIIMHGTKTLSKEFDSIHMGSETATMLAVASCVNEHACSS